MGKNKPSEKANGIVEKLARIIYSKIYITQLANKILLILLLGT